MDTSTAVAPTTTGVLHEAASPRDARRSDPSHTVTTNPAPTPATAMRSTSAKRSRLSVLGSAPREARTASSPLRVATVYARTPWRPKPARSTASAESPRRR